MENLILSLPLFFFCLVIHEYAHGLMAERCGDSTARYLGRLTLNPMAHIDPVGTVILPIMLLLLHSPFVFGWAKPVPINPFNFRNPRWDTVKVGLAGPGANIATALASALLLKVLALFGLASGIAVTIFVTLILVSLVLAFFNLVPVPPLDGSHVVAGFLPARLAYRYESMQRFGFIFVIILMYLGFFTGVIFPLAYKVTGLLLPKEVMFI